MEFWDVQTEMRKIEDRKWNFGTSRHKLEKSRIESGIFGSPDIYEKNRESKVEFWDVET